MVSVRVLPALDETDKCEMGVGAQAEGSAINWFAIPWGWTHPLGSNKFLLILSAENDPGFERLCIPTRHIHRHDGLVTTGRDAKELNHRDPVFVCRSKPLVVGGVRVIPHKGIVDRVVAFENLAVDFPLIVVPDPSARARKHSPDREQVTHAPWLEDPALRVHEGDAVVVEFELGAQLLLREVTMHFAQEPDALEGGEAHQNVGVVGAHAVAVNSVMSTWVASLQLDTLERVTAEYGKPKSIRLDQGAEFVSKAMDLWAYLNGVSLDFSRPGKPTDNAFIESLNGSFRAECLNASWFFEPCRCPVKM